MDSTKSIVLFGDSLLGRFNKNLIDKLGNSLEGYIVYNCATGGFNTEDGAKRADYIARLKPDCVILSFGANDFAPWKKQLSEQAFKKNFEAIVKSFRGSKIIIFPCPPVSIHGIPKIIMNRLFSKYYATLKLLADKNEAEFINSQKVYKELTEKGINYHEGDGLHLNEVGYDVLIKEIVKLLQYS